MQSLKHPVSGRPLTVIDSAADCPDNPDVVFLRRDWKPAEDDFYIDGWEGLRVTARCDIREFVAAGGSREDFHLGKATVPAQLRKALETLTQDQVDHHYRHRLPAKPPVGFFEA